MLTADMLAAGWTDEGAGDWSRTDPDGTRWVLCPESPGVYTLALLYREHRLISRHPDAEAAVRHRTDMIRMFAARSLRDYSGRR